VSKADKKQIKIRCIGCYFILLCNETYRIKTIFTLCIWV